MISNADYSQYLWQAISFDQTNQCYTEFYLLILQQYFMEGPINSNQSNPYFEYDIYPNSRYNEYSPLILTVIYGTSRFDYVLDYSILSRVTKKQKGINNSSQFYQELKVSEIIQKYFLFYNQKLIIKQFNWQIQPSQASELINNKQGLDKLDSLVYLAFQVIKFIFDGKNFESDLFNLNVRTIKSVRENILQKIAILSPLLIDPQAKLQISSFFDFELSQKYPITLNSDVYNQDRFRDASSIQQHLVFNPTKITNHIFNKTLNPNLKKVILFGNSGIGKSISIVLMVELFKIIADYRMKFSKEIINNFLEHMNVSKEERQFFYKIPKIYYLSVTDHINKLNVINIIQKQTPQFIDWRVNMESFQKDKYQAYIQQLQQEYKQREIQCVIVMDQINIYYSFIRKCINLWRLDKAIATNIYCQQLHNISDSLTLFKDKFQKVIYITSPGIEKQLYKKANHICNFSLQSLIHGQMADDRINYEQFRCDAKGFLQIVNTVVFEYENALIRQFEYKKINQQKGIFQTILLRDQIVSKLFNNYSFSAGQFTHLRVRQYFTRWKYISKQIFLFIDQQKSEIFQRISIILQQIKKIIIDRGIQSFKNFLNSDVNKQLLYKKLRYLHYIQKTIINDCTDKKQCFFEIIIDKNSKSIGTEFNRWNQQNVFINQSQNIMKIFYYRTTFLYIIQNTLLSTSIIGKAVDHILDVFGSDKAILSQLAGNCLIKLITRNTVSLCLGDQQFIAVYQEECPFLHFNNRKQSVFIQQKLKTPFQILQNNQFKEREYLATVPSPDYFDSLKNIPNAQYPQSYGSRCIDCMLIKKSIQHVYELKTMDFSVSTQINTVNVKLKAAKQFFSWLNSQIQNNSSIYTLHITHYLVIPMQLFEHSKYQSTISYGNIELTLTTTPIQKLNIHVVKRKHQGLNLVLSTYRSIMSYLNDHK